MRSNRGVRKQCFDKRFYHTLLEARKAAGKAWLFDARRLWPYRCDICDLWHLTSKSPDEQIEKGYDPTLK